MRGPWLSYSQFTLGGPGADYFDCGEGTDVVVDFNVSENDDNAGNCEEIIGTETISIG
jgi:hypothetical protein